MCSQLSWEEVMLFPVQKVRLIRDLLKVLVEQEDAKQESFISCISRLPHAHCPFRRP